MHWRSGWPGGGEKLRQWQLLPVARAGTAGLLPRQPVLVDGLLRHHPAARGLPSCLPCPWLVCLATRPHRQDHHSLPVRNPRVSRTAANHGARRVLARPPKSSGPRSARGGDGKRLRVCAQVRESRAAMSRAVRSPQFAQLRPWPQQIARCPSVLCRFPAVSRGRRARCPGSFGRPRPTRFDCGCCRQRALLLSRTRSRLWARCR